jgi:tripartite-type tricarboxylate transporter receptor subunit TctC
MAQRMSEILGQQVVVENLSGAGGTVGSVHVAKAMPDGYRFVLGNSGTHVWSQSLYKKPPYNTASDFSPVSLEFCLSVRRSRPLNEEVQNISPNCGGWRRKESQSERV